MTKIIISVSDNGKSIKINNIVIERANSVVPNSLASIQFQVNNRLLSSTQSKNYFNYLAQQDSIFINDTNRQILQQALQIGFLPPAIRAKTANIHHLPQANSFTWNDVFEYTVKGAEHYIFTTLVELGNNQLAHRQNSQTLTRLKNTYNLGNRALRREQLTRGLQQGLGKFATNIFSSFAYSGRTLMDAKAGIEKLQKNSKNKITEFEKNKIWGDAIAKNGLIYFSYESKYYVNAIKFLTDSLQKLAIRIGIGTLHPFVATGIVLLTVGSIVHEFDLLNLGWTTLKTGITDILDLSQAMDSCYAASPRNFCPSHSPVFKQLLATAQPTAITSVNSSATTIYQPKNNCESIPLPQNPIQPLHGFLKDNFNTKNLFLRSEATPEQLKNFQRSIKEHFALDSAPKNYFLKLDPTVLLPKESNPPYIPGDRGSFSCNYENGKLNYHVKVDLLKAPQIAIPIITLKIILSYLQWHRLSPSEKAFITATNQLDKLQAAKNHDWSSLSILLQRVTFHSYDEIEHYYHHQAITAVQRVLTTHADNPNIFSTFKAINTALISGNKNLIDNIQNEQTLISETTKIYNDLLEKYECEINANNVPGARVISDKLLKEYDFDIGTHLIGADRFIHEGNYRRTKTEIDKADQCIKREQEWIEKIPEIVQENAEGRYESNRSQYSANIKQAQNQLANIKFNLYLFQYRDAANNQKQKSYQSLLDHTNDCITQMSDDQQFLKNHIHVLLLENNFKEAIHFQKKLSTQSGDPLDYCQLAHSYEHMGDLLSANKIYENIKGTEEINYYAAIKARTNYFQLISDAHKNKQLELIPNLSQAALIVAKQAYDSDHAVASDGYFYGVLALQDNQKKQGQVALEYFVSTPFEDEKKLKVTAKTEEINKILETDKLLRADAYSKLGILEAEKNNFAKAIENFESSLKLNSKDARTLAFYSATLQRLCNFSKATEKMKEALVYGSNDEVVLDLEKYVKDHREAHLIFAYGLGLRFFASLLDTTLEYLRVTILQRQLVRQVIHVSSDLVITKLVKGHFLPKHKTQMGQYAYYLSKGVAIFYLTDSCIQLVGPILSKKLQPYINTPSFLQTGQFPQELRNTAHCLQVTAEIAYGFDLFLNDFNPAAAGAYLLASGPNIVESVLRGGYRVWKGEYYPRIENQPYLFTKEFCREVGTVASIASFSPDTTVLVIAKVAAVVGSGGVALIAAGIATGIVINSYNHSWHEKLSAMTNNAHAFAIKNKTDDAIVTLQQCLKDLQPKEEIAKKIKSQLKHYSEIRLLNDTQKIIVKEESLNQTDMTTIIAAYNTHLKDVPEDTERKNQLNVFETFSKINSAFINKLPKVGFKLWEDYLAKHPEDTFQKNEYLQSKFGFYLQNGKTVNAKYLCERYLKENENDAIALACRTQLHLHLGNTFAARSDARRLVKLKPEDPLTYQNLSLVQQAENNLNSAQKSLDKAKKLLLAASKNDEQKQIPKTDAQLNQPATTGDQMKPLSKTEQKRIAEQLDRVEKIIKARWNQNITQIVTGFLQACISTYINVTTLNSTHLHKPPLPFWDTCNLQPGELEASLSDIGEEKPSNFSDFPVTGETELPTAEVIDSLKINSEVETNPNKDSELQLVGENELSAIEVLQSLQLGDKIEILPHHKVDIVIVRENNSNSNGKGYFSLPESFSKRQKFWTKLPVQHTIHPDETSPLQLLVQKKQFTI